MLKVLNASLPLGEFDGLDTEFLTLKGGEVVTLKGVVNTPATDKGAADVFDGYVGTSSFLRPAVTKTLASGNRPLFLADDGTAGYGTLFGTVVGGTAGQVTSGTVLGPHTSTGSGKVTLWGSQGLFAVTLDAVDTNSSTGLTVTNTTLTTGAALYPTTAGLLTPNSGAAIDATAVVGRFLEFDTNESLVNTPSYLVAALNSPSGSVSSALPRAFTVAKFWFAGCAI